MVYRTAPFSMILNKPWPIYHGHAILWRWRSHKLLKIQPSLLWKVNRKPHPSFQMVPVWMTLSDLQPRFQGHDIIQCPIIQKRYKIELYFFSASGSQTILVFPYQTPWQQSHGTPALTGMSNAGVEGTNRDRWR